MYSMTITSIEIYSYQIHIKPLCFAQMRFFTEYFSSYVFMIGEKLLSQTEASEDDDESRTAGWYKVADQQDISKFSNIFYQTGRLQGADKYIWISPFIRYILYYIDRFA